MFKVMMYEEDSTFLDVALSRNLFPRPDEDEEILAEHISGNRVVLYFDRSYYETLVESMVENKNKGKFAESNAEEEWGHLLDRMLARREVEDVDRSRLDEYRLI